MFKFFKTVFFNFGFYQQGYGNCNFSDLDIGSQNELPTGEMYSKIYEIEEKNNYNYPNMEEFIEHKEKAAAVIESLYDFTKPGLNILSFGAGLGITESQLFRKNSGLKITVMDFIKNSKYLDKAIDTKQHLDDVPSNSLDVILVLSVFYAFDDKGIDEQLALFDRVLKENGVLLISEVDSFNLRSMLRNLCIGMLISLRFSAVKHHKLFGFLRPPSKYIEVFKRNGFLKKDLYCVDEKYNSAKKAIRWFGYQFPRRSSHMSFITFCRERGSRKRNESQH